MSSDLVTIAQVSRTTPGPPGSYALVGRKEGTDQKTFSLIYDSCEGHFLPKLTWHFLDFYL